jgi:GH35 family endo-1,4-beta-xylanase
MWTRTWHLVTGVVAAAILGYLFWEQLLLLGLGLWVTRFDHGTVELMAYDSDGNSLKSVEFLRTWRPAMIVRDQTGSSVFGLQYGLGMVRIAVPSGQSVSLEMLWPVPGFGKVLVDADHEGQGYRVPVGGTIRLELLLEFARSRISQVKRWIDTHNGGRCASHEAEQELDSASRLILEIELSTEARRRAMLSLRALRLALWAGESEVLAEAREAIRNRRYGVLRVKVEDRDGRPLSGVRIKMIQQRFDFLFGVYSDGYDPDTINRLKALGLNYAILFMTWRRTEPARGVFSLDEFDRFSETTALSKSGFTLCGHGLVWLASGEVPPYIEKMRGRTDDLIVAVREHAARLLKRYRGAVQIWEAINEGHPQWSRLGLKDAGMVRVAKASVEEIRRLAPSAQIIVDVALPLDEDVSLKYYPLIGLVSLGRIGSLSSDPYQYLERLADAGVVYDLVALQVFNGAWVNVAWGVQVPAIDLFRFARLLDRYSKLGKPLQIAEIAVGSSHHGGTFESWWHARANQETQADYLEGVFTIAYGNSGVQGINWWGLYDDYQFVQDGGLFDRSRRPKIAAQRLGKLLEQWRSSGEIVSDHDGWASLEGAAGDYQVSAQVGASHLSTKGHIAAGQAAALILRGSARKYRNFTTPRERR